MRTTITDWEKLPQDRRPARPLFAIGDVHGHSDALAAQFDHLRAIIEQEHAGQDVDVVFLGDYVDRGPDPNGVLELIHDGLDLAHVHEAALIGNHDWMLMAAAGIRGLFLDVDDWAVWLGNGGRETLAGLGGINWRKATPERVQEGLSPKALATLNALGYSFRSGDILCVHAGVDPDRPLDAQRERDVLWIRDPFLRPAERATEPWAPGVTVVHGHTPNAYGVFAHRIGVDTGGYSTGIFTAVEIRTDGLRFHHTRKS